MSISRTLTGAVTAAAVFVAMPLMAPTLPGGTTIYVDDDNCPGPGDGSIGDPYCSIQTAIDNAVDGDEVMVAPGYYVPISSGGLIDLLGKAITLRSSDGPEATFIVGFGVRGAPLVTCRSGEGQDTVVDGFNVGGGAGSKSGGAIYILDSSPTVMNCTLTSQATRGGGIYMENSEALIIACTFLGCSANSFDMDESAFGGGVYCRNSDATMINCSFVRNWTREDSVYFSDIGTCFPTSSSAGSALYCDSLSSPALINCTISASLKLSTCWCCGKGFPCDIMGCEVLFDSTGLSSAVEGGTPILINCILWGNSTNPITSQASVYYSVVEGGWSGRGHHNIHADPLFVRNTGPGKDGDWLTSDDDHGDLRLLPDSPCIDAGNNNAIADLTDTDLDGNPRFADDPATDDTGCGVPVQVDMGAYEFQGDPADVVFADLTGDGTVSMDDLDMLLDCWSTSKELCDLACRADLDLDGRVSTTDLLILLANWN